MSTTPPRIDLFVWSSRGSVRWSRGDVADLDASWKATSEQLDRWARSSAAEYALVWPAGVQLPDEATLDALIESGVDVAHAGLAQGLGTVLPDLDMVMHDWSMINASPTLASSSWRLGLDRCLIRRSTWLALGGLDRAYESRVAAGLDWGRRCLVGGALVEHRPELAIGIGAPDTQVDPVDLYTFVLRHYGARWAQYVMIRRTLRFANERQHLARARTAVAEVAAPERRHAWREITDWPLERLQQIPVTVIIPTLGRYPYLPGAIDSLRRQTVRPREVVIVDQNVPEDRQPAVYEGYEDLNLRVVWQDARGQSLARNTAIAEVTSPYVFLFDDDSIAHDDLIEQHLRVVIAGRFDASTGVAFPPPPTDYQLPITFSEPRVSQTFDTGNSLLRTALVREMGAFDRNYDFGPGTDADFGTRLYLAGKRVAHNPHAVRVHFKAPMGGLRVHGAHKYNTDAGLVSAFPPVTQSYYQTRYLEPRQRLERTLVQFATSKISPEARRGDPRAFVTLALTSMLLPVKWWRSNRRARELLETGVRTEKFDAS